MTSPEFSHLFVTKRRKDRPDKARDPQAGTPGPRKRTVWYVEEGGVPACGLRNTVRPDHCADAVEGV